MPRATYKKGWLKVSTCKGTNCCNLMPPRKKRGHPPHYCSDECRPRPPKKPSMPTISRHGPDQPCSHRPCTCGRDYLAMELTNDLC